MNSAFVGYEELSRSRRVLSTEALGPNRNCPFHLMNQPKFPDFGLNGKRPYPWFTCPPTIHFKFITKCDKCYYKVRQLIAFVRTHPNLVSLRH